MRLLVRPMTLVLCALGIAPGAIAQATLESPPLTDREKMLLDRIEKLEQRIAALEAAQKQTGAPPVSAPAQPAAPAPAQEQRSPTGDSVSLSGFLAGTTLNVLLDGYYGYNFNRPTGRVNLLRAYDVLSNSFSLNQAALVMERAPDLAARRRLGLRLDLMYGQATETLQGSPVNEPRPQVYRPVFQAYGTYVVPLGSGLTVDFGKWASAFGYENNYTKDQINYSRSYYFDFLPFYHFGFRSNYNISDKLGLQYWLINGLNQSEDFNGFKSSAVLFTIKPRKTVSWNLNYYVGRDQRDVQPDLNPGLPAFPSQPGLSTVPARALRGRGHIFETYVSWNATTRLLLVGELDHVVSRLQSTSPPMHVSGGAAYLRYQVWPAFSLAGRFEYLDDHGGLFSGVSQALKEGTLTATWQVADGFQVRGEYRRDFSNLPFFLTSIPGLLKKEQNTATLGLVWWLGGKQGSW